MVAARTFFARMNEGRTGWMTEGRLVKGCEEFFNSNGYDQIERDVLFDQGDRVFNSLLVGSKEGEAGKETIASYFKPRIDKYDIGSFGSVEAMLYDVIDNYENTNLMLVTDSLSYTPMTKIEDLSVALEGLMDEGLFLLFMNERAGYALFDEFKKLTAPIPVSD
jgi:hypothetical protein